MTKVIYFENVNSPIGNTVVGFNQDRLGDADGIAERAIAKQGLPESTPWELIDDEQVPLFKDARKSEGGKLVTGTNGAKEIAHDIRRKARSSEFMPIDGDNPALLVSEEAELQRVEIRNKYHTSQDNIDNASSVEGIEGAMRNDGLI